MRSLLLALLTTTLALPLSAQTKPRDGDAIEFIDAMKEGARRDPQRAGFTMALPGAIKSYVVWPDLESVPEWASSRPSPGLRPPSPRVAGRGDSDPEQFVPDSIKGSPGCYLVRGSVPLSDVDPGLLHEILVTITGGGGRASYNLTREFRIE